MTKYPNSNNFHFQHRLKQHTSSFKSLKIVAELSICFLGLQGCTLRNTPPAPIENASNHEAVNTKPVESSHSYPLPMPPAIMTATSYSVTDPQTSLESQVAYNLKVDSDIISQPQTNEPVSSENGRNTPNVKGIANNSPITINTQKFNYIANDGEPNWQKMSQHSIDSLIKNHPTISELKGLLFINSISNQTNASLPIYVIDQLLNQSLAGKLSLTIANQSTINQAKSQLNIPVNDSLISISKSIAIGRSMEANYILFASANGDGESPKLKVQLIDTLSAEIIAEGSSPAIF